MARPSTGSDGGQAAIVVLCADEAARERLAYWLSNAGARVDVAHSGQEARRLLLQRPSVLVITDRLLPPWPGLDTIVNLKAERHGIRVAFIDDGVPDNRALALSAGADLVLARPLRRTQVLQACFSSDPTVGGLACAS